MEGPKEKWGQKTFFATELGPLHFQFASYAYDLPRLWDCDIDVLVQQW